MTIKPKNKRNELQRLDPASLAKYENKSNRNSDKKTVEKRP